MPSDLSCDRVMEELSVAHDERGASESWVEEHLRDCSECSEFATQIGSLGAALASGRYDLAPDVAPAVVAAISRPHREWWSVAAVALVGLVAGTLVGLASTRLDVGQAQDLSELFHTAGTDLDGLTADIVVVERGVHETVPERVYTGTLDYVAPEQLALSLVDTTEYPGVNWIPNDVRLVISDGDVVSTSGNACPVPALPECLVVPMTTALLDQPPFGDGVQIPLEIVGPGRSLGLPSGVEVVGATELDGSPTIQLKSTVAAVEIIGAITDRGAWRDLHPTDPVVMWLDEATMAPRRIEVFTADTPERELWQLRRGYEDEPGGDAPIFIVELSNLVIEPGTIEFEAPGDPPSLGFVDDETTLPEPTLPAGFKHHRTGHRPLPDGEPVDVASWSDGRSWIMVEVTRGWTEPNLFGLSSPFVERIDLRAGSVGYLSPAGNAVAIHGEDSEVLVTGSVPRETLLEAAASLDVTGLEVPASWLEASTVAISDLPAGTLVPEVEGWSILGRMGPDGTTLLLSSGGARSVLVTQSAGTRLDPPTGPDFSEVGVRGVEGRHDLSSSALEWVEDGRILQIRSETVGIDELLDLAKAMVPR